jgi:hypothetical protein
MADLYSQLALAAEAPAGASPSASAALAAALTASVRSLTTFQRVQAERLEETTGSLKQEFRSRLEELEADFLRRAQALSDELATAVADCRWECEEAVGRHGQELHEGILVVREAAATVEKGGDSDGRGKELLPGSSLARRAARAAELEARWSWRRGAADASAAGASAADASAVGGTSELLDASAPRRVPPAMAGLSDSDSD